MEFYELIKNRYSVRSFTGECVRKDALDKILEAAHLAPTGCNFQPQRILVLNTPEAIEKLQKCTRSHFGAPTALLVCYNKDECWTRKYDDALSGPIDACIVATHMLLAAENEGVGCTWIMHFDPFKMREEFNIPENIIPVALLVMGYAADDAKPHPYHSQFRDMSETVKYDTF